MNYGVVVHFLCFVGSWVCKLRQAKALSSFNFRFDFKFLQQALLSCSLGFDLFVVKSWTSVPYKKKCWKRASTTSSETDLSSGDIYFGQKNRLKICFSIKGDEYEEQVQFKDWEFSQTKTKEWSLIANSSKPKTRQMTSVRLFKILFTIYDRNTNKRKTTKRPYLIQNSWSTLLCNPWFHLW